MANYPALAMRLLSGETIQFRPRGNSMTPIIESGQLVTIAPLHGRTVEPGNVVFCKVKGNFYVHLVKAVQGNRIQIGNNHGHINGWTTTVYGILSGVEK